MQLSQGPPQLRSQHTPSAQYPLAHSPSLIHICPLSLSHPRLSREQVSPAGQSSSGSVPEAAGSQRPLALQRSHRPSHAVSQQRPSTQNPEAQVSSPEQVVPSAMTPSHFPVSILQKNPSSQSAGLAHDDPAFAAQIPSAPHHEVPSQRPGFSARTIVSQVPVSSPKQVSQGLEHSVSQQNPTVGVTRMQCPETQSFELLH